MKKILSLILCLSMLLSFGTMAFASAEEELVINVASDIHLNNAWEKPIPKRNTVSETFSHVASEGKLNSESMAIIAAFLDGAAASDSEVVLIPGDLADYGYESEMLDVAEIFSKFEKNTGKQIYVVPGNHDVSKLSVSVFMRVFADFGYNEAIAKDSNSASYVVDLPDGYRLLAIDSTLQSSGNWGIDAKRAEWIRQQAQTAQEEGKKTIAMMHHNLVPHLVLIDVLHKGSVLGKATGLSDIFAQYGVKYVFTGHTHESDIASYVGANGEVVYDVLTGALNVYPCPYRTVTFGDDVKFEMNYVDKVETEYIPSGMSAEAFDLLEKDFMEYSEYCFTLGMKMAVNNTVCSASYLKSALNVNKNDNPEICALIDKLAPKLKEAVAMPLYAKDETEEGKSIESVLAYYGVTIPDSSYKNVAELGVSIYGAHTLGDENLQPYSKEIVLASKGIGAVLAYVLSDVSAEDYAMVLSYVCQLADLELSTNLLTLAGDKIKRFEGIELVVSTAIIPLILKVTIDEAPGDCNVTLPGYAELIEAPEAEKTFWDKVQDFFIKIFAAIMSIFAFM